MSDSVTWRRCQRCGTFAKQYLNKVSGFKLCDVCQAAEAQLPGRPR